jgi:hypothetical protein
MTRSLPGEGWYSLGWLGVLLWCGLCGYLLGWIYRRYVESDQSTFKTASYLMFLPVLIVAFRDGQIVTVFRQGIFFLAPIGMWILVARFFNVPMARDLRRILARRQTTIASAPGKTAEASPPAGNWQDLPPAVRRRRLALDAKRIGMA